MSPSYKELLGIDGEAIELEWNIFPGSSSLQILQEIQNDLRKRNIEAEKFTDWIIFMSMFNDIEWTKKGNDGICVSNSESQGIREESLAGTLDISRSWRRQEVVWNSPLHTWRKMRFYSHSKWWNASKIQVIQYSRVWALWVVEFWRRRMAETPYTSMRMLQTLNSCSESQYLRSSFELVWTIRLVRWRKGTRKAEKNLWPKVHWQV